MSTRDHPIIVEASHQNEERTKAYYTSSAARYDWRTGYERAHHEEACSLAALQEGEHVLEVACGTGRATVALARLVGPKGKVEALDLTEAMLQQARQKIQALGLSERVEFKAGDAKHLPYPDSLFDVLYNSYMFDLLAVDQFEPILTEFRRVLKPGGRLVLVNMSKNRPEKIWFESLYERGWMGACRPVLLKDFVQRVGFEEVQRRYRKSSALVLPLPFGTEIVTAHKRV
jgi:ubiquinone/menaquinone biosynthesis C-methylase UbiE